MYSFSARRLTVYVLLLLVILSLPGIAPHTVRAQDGDSPNSTLTEEQLAWLTYAHEAIVKLDTLTNYTMTHSGTMHIDLTLRQGSESLAGSQSESWQRTQTVFPGDPATIEAALTSTSSTVEFGAAEATSYGLVAEARFVEGVLYVTITPLATGADLSQLPTGWIVVDDPENYPALASLQLDDLIDDEPLFTDLDALVSTAQDVTWEAVTLADGSAADQITVVFGVEFIFTDAYDLSVEDQARWRAVLDSASAAEIGITITVTIDQDGLPVLYVGKLQWQIVGADAAGFFAAELPTGTLLDLVMESAQESTLIAYDEPRIPAVAPDEFTDPATQD
ncbi:MAG: hypothetical protein JXA10_05410 [Anaerolineae bacterium]|nr:hypothetical protein [Anaerolineae bacterium]